LATRILGMGDMLTLIEKAQETFDQDQAAKAAQKMMEARFDMEDFLQQLKQVKKMGPIGGLLDMIPGLGNMRQQIDANEAEKSMTQIEAIINSMTPTERQRPDIIGGGRKRRIARGSGTSVQEVNQLLRQFREMQKMMKMMQNNKGRGMANLLKGKF
jgi:signal recognition particle subunit SRP54